MMILLTTAIVVSLVSGGHPPVNVNSSGLSTRNVFKEEGNPDRVRSPEDIPNLLTFWDFQEASGISKVAKGKFQYRLEEMNGPIRLADDGIFGKYSVDFEWGQWMRLKREQAPGLNLHGTNQQVTMVAWIKRRSDRAWQYIAGVWNEGDKRFMGAAEGKGERYPSRQYALFTSGNSQNDYTTYKRSPAKHQAMGYLSPYGGATPNHPFAFDYATGATFLEKDRWYMIAFTYDGQWIKVYVDGKVDTNEKFNPFKYEGPIFDGGQNGADFTVAHRDHPHWPNYPEGTPQYKEGFDGRLGGLAVYDRALSEKEIKALYSATMKGR